MIFDRTPSYPGSITTFTPFIVIDVSAILVAKITLQSFDYLNTYDCYYGVKRPCKLNILKKLGDNFFSNKFTKEQI